MQLSWRLWYSFCLYNKSSLRHEHNGMEFPFQTTAVLIHAVCLLQVTLAFASIRLHRLSSTKGDTFNNGTACCFISTNIEVNNCQAEVGDRRVRNRLHRETHRRPSHFWSLSGGLIPTGMSPVFQVTCLRLGPTHWACLGDKCSA